MLSIIITHYKTPILLKLCLKSIKKNIGQLEHEIIVVDSETQPETQEMLKEEFPEVDLIGFKKNVGYAKIVNAGLKKAKGKFLLILNADIIVLNQAIQKMLKFLQNNPQVGLIGPQLLTFTNQIQLSCFNQPDFWAIIGRRTFLGKLKWFRKRIEKFLIADWDRKSTRPVPWLQGSAMMTSKKAVKKVGLFDERFFMYFEDADWCQRFWQAGYQVVYFSEAKMLHYYHRASKKWGGFLDFFFNPYTRIHFWSALKYFAKWR